MKILIQVLCVEHNLAHDKEEKIIHEWENIVGKEIANFIIPTGLNKNKTIKVLCDSSFALELQHISPKIIDAKTVAITGSPSGNAETIVGDTYFTE